MTPAQEEAFNKIEDIMREHFESAVFVVSGETGDDGSNVIRCGWHGGYATAIGLLNLGDFEVKKSAQNESFTD